MGIACRLAIVPLLIALAPPVVATDASPTGPATREGLVAAWEARIGTEGRLEKQADGSYLLEAPAIGYSGRLVLDGALVREQPYAAQTGIGHIGVVDFSLPDLPPARANAQFVLMWRSGLQQFVHLADRGWVHGDDAFDPEALPGLAGAGWWNLLLAGAAGCS